MAERAYTKDEKEALDKVLDMGFIVENQNGDRAKADFGSYNIEFHNGTEKNYKALSRTLNALFKNH